MRFNQIFVKSGAKMMVITGLAIGISGSVFAQSTSIVSTMNNQSAIGNTQTTVQSMAKGKSGGGPGNNSGGNPGGKNGGKSGGTTGGGNNPPGCVPEPATMLALGLGAGIVALKRKKASKSA